MGKPRSILNPEPYFHCLFSLQTHPNRVVWRVETGFINPAVSLAAAVVGDITWTRFAVCLCAEMLGGFLGGFLVWLTYIPHFQPLEFVESTEESICDCCDLEANGVAIIKQELSEPAHR